MLQRAGIGSDAPGRDRAIAQGPHETLVPVLALLLGLHFGQRLCHPAIGAVDGFVERVTRLVLQAVLAIPDVFRGRLKGRGDLRAAVGGSDLECFYGHVRLARVLGRLILREFFSGWPFPTHENPPISRRRDGAFRDTKLKMQCNGGDSKHNM